MKNLIRHSAVVTDNEEKLNFSYKAIANQGDNLGLSI